MTTKEHPLRRRSPASPPTPDAPGEMKQTIPMPKENDARKIADALRERVKELNCLYGISRLHQKFPESLDTFLEGVVNILPFSWQYPELTCVRITYKEKTYASRDFRSSPWRQEAGIMVRMERVGKVEVYYMEECPPADLGPFLKEEQSLLNTVADNIALNATRIAAEHEVREVNRMLKIEQQSLLGANEALRTLLDRISDEKHEIQADIHANIEKVVKPLLLALAMEVTASQRKYVEMILDSLERIASPLVDSPARNLEKLTPTEINICTMIRCGLKTKEIAQLRKVSPATVHRHRERIRHKLGLANTGMNLGTHLQSLLA